MYDRCQCTIGANVRSVHQRWELMPAPAFIQKVGKWGKSKECKEACEVGAALSARVRLETQCVAFVPRIGSLGRPTMADVGSSNSVCRRMEVALDPHGPTMVDYEKVGW
jgi:hypothetical protein